MGGLRKFVDKIKPTFSEGGKLSFVASTFDAFETFLFVPNTTTSRGANIRDCNDMKRTMIVVVVVVGGFFGYKYLISGPRAEKAAAMMFVAEQQFAGDSFALALNGDGNFAGFLEVIDRYGSTDEGNLARHYAGICYLRLGEYQQALDYL